VLLRHTRAVFGWLRRRKAQTEAVHRSGPVAGWVSVWVGDLTDELDLDGYFYEFDEEHGLFKRGDDGGYCVKDSPQPLEALLESFFSSKTWLPALLELAEERGIHRASCAVIQFHYLHEPVAEAPGPLKFVGAVQIEARPGR